MSVATERPTDTSVPFRASGPPRSGRWWRDTWPLTGHRAAVLLGLLTIVVAAGALIGILLTDVTQPNPVTDLDRRLADRFVDERTSTRTTLATWGAFLADTEVKILLTLAATAAMLWRWKRWHEAAFVALTLVFEATAFITITAIVGRSRPAVPRLLDSPVDSSFPSGHVAAATVYGAFAIVVFWHTRARWARSIAVAGAVAVPVVVGLARMYQGMHFLSDVIAGIVLGLVTLAICVRVLGPPPPERGGAADGDDVEAVPEDTSLELAVTGAGA